jgi:hypothetical protein
MAGAGYKLFSTGDVLSASDVNTYLQQQTVMVFASAAARTTALASVLAEGMVTYLKDTDVVEIYTGAAWVSLDDPNAIQNSIVDAKGDIITATADNTPARLAVGTNGQTLVADSTASTGLKWDTPASGGWTSIASGTLSGASVSLTSIPATYKNLTLYLNNPYASTTADFRMTVNSDTSNSYSTWAWQSAGTLSSWQDTYIRLVAANSLTATSNNYGFAVLEFPNYYSTTGIKMGRLLYQGTDSVPYGGYWRAVQSYVPAAISSIQLKTSTGTFSGGTYELWGQK